MATSIAICAICNQSSIFYKTQYSCSTFCIYKYRAACTTPVVFSFHNCKFLDTHDYTNERITGKGNEKDYWNFPNAITTSTRLFGKLKLNRAALMFGKLLNSENSNYVMVPRTEFFGTENLSSKWQGTFLILNSVSDYIYSAKDLRNNSIKYIYVFWLKCSTDKD